MAAQALVIQALVNNVVTAQVGNYQDAGRAMRALHDGAADLTRPQKLSVLNAMVNPGNRNNQLTGGYTENVWPARKGQAIIGPFLEKFVLAAPLDTAGMSANEQKAMFSALQFCTLTAASYIR